MHLRCGQVLVASAVFSHFTAKLGSFICTPVYMCTSFLIHLPVERNWSCLQFLKMMNGTDTKLYIGFGVSLKVEMMSHVLSIC